MNKRGQALIEFVLLLPIFIFLLLGIIDIGKVILTKTEIESELSEVLDMHRHHESYEEISAKLKKQDRTLNFEIQKNEDQTLTLVVQKEIDIVTPGLGIILGNPCRLEAKKVIENES